MLYVIDCLASVLLAIVLIQDLKQREISWILIPSLFIVLTAKGIYQIPVKELIRYTLINFGFIVFQLSLLTVYMSIKNRKFEFIVNTYLGLGDILFFVVICVAFSPVNFIYFYFLGLLVTLITFLVYRLLVKNATSEIPLAGVFAAAMALLIIVNHCWPQLNFYDDGLLTLGYMNE